MMFLKLTLNALYQALFRKKKMIGHHARLRDGIKNLAQFMPVLVLITRVIHQCTLHFAVVESIGKKKLDR